MIELTKICDDFIARSDPRQGLSRTALEAHLLEHGCRPGQATHLLDLNDRFGGCRIRNRNRTDHEIFWTIGRRVTVRHSDKAAGPIMGFFDFGVAAPYEVVVQLDGSVVAENGLEWIHVADSFECFLEGIAHDDAARTRFAETASTSPNSGFAKALATLPTEDLVAEATDQFNAWWSTDTWMAQLRTPWGASPTSVDLIVWNPASAPLTFRALVLDA